MGKELSVAADAACVVHEGDELRLELPSGVRDIGPAHCIGLPELIRVGFGKSETRFVVGLADAFEHLKAFDNAATHDSEARLWV